MSASIVIDVSSVGPVGFVKTGVTAYLESNGERFTLESAHTNYYAKILMEKWKQFVLDNGPNITFTLSPDAAKWCE